MLELETTRKSTISIPYKLILDTTTHVKYGPDLWDISDRAKPLLVERSMDIAEHRHVQDFTPGMKHTTRLSGPESFDLTPDTKAALEERGDEALDNLTDEEFKGKLE